MPKRFDEYTRSRVVRLIGFQACFVCLVILGLILFMQSQIVFSVFVGFVIFFIPNWLFILFSYRKYNVKEPVQAIKNIYIGQAMKLALVVGLGALCIHWFTINSLAFLLAFIVSILAHCLTLLLIFQRR
ncbi:ATP synthase subunit I [Celerinatantimonas yamalensis]|uniref:ATP synthase subunit I n=1 Tax=Celerinatantimonas yamalensis TaxID=559956 RepID=A0ABW9G8I7_9GAMM